MKNYNIKTGEFYFTGFDINTQEISFLCFRLPANSLRIRDC